MAPVFSLPDFLSVDDLQLYLSRAARVEDGSVRLIAGGTVLAAYVAVLHPSGLLDESPTVLGLRTFALTVPVTFDAVVSVRSVLERLVRLQKEMTDASAPVPVSVPTEVNTVPWAAISPPRSGWVALDSLDAGEIEQVAKSGIDEVAAAVPTGTGEQIVHRVRAEVWGRPIGGLERVPAGGAFAALSLGFLGGDDAVRVFEAGPWVRLSTERGHVLIKRRARALLG